PKNGASFPGPSAQVSGTAINVTSKSQIQVKLNGVNVPFNYSTSTKSFSASLTLKSGNNVVVVTATTNCGTDSKTITVSYTAPCPKPTVSISSPRNGTKVNGSAMTVSGSFTNIPNKSDMQVKLNGVNQNFSFNSSSKTYSASLKLRSGSNTIVVTASTNCGTSTKTISVTSSQIIKPIINVFTPNVDTSVVKNNQVTLTGEVQKITGQSKLTITINGKSFTKYSFNKTGTEKFIFDGTMALNPGVNVVVIRAVHVSGGVEVKTKVITVNTQVVAPNPRGSKVANPERNVAKPSTGGRTPRKR
ncbi:MAG: Ig-like domain-containing protein, partial [Flavobacteriales bacterium]